MYIYEALRRKKDKENEGLEEFCIRQIVKDEKKDLNILIARINEEKGLWRIYRTVNKRNPKKAYKLLLKQMTEKMYDCDDIADRIDSLWRSALSARECRAEDKFLVDIDTEDSSVKSAILATLQDKGIDVFQVVKTVNGWHIVSERFDSRILAEYKNVSVKRDSLVFVELYQA